MLHQKKKIRKLDYFYLILNLETLSKDSKIQKEKKEKLHYPLIKISPLIRALRQSRSRSNNFVANRADIKHRGEDPLWQRD